MTSADVVIIGAGVIGNAIAYHLARCSRLRVVVIDRGSAGGEASSAAAGVLAVASGQARRGALFELRRLSAEMFPELVASLEQETGIDLGYQRTGLLSLAFSDSEAVALRDLVRHRTHQGLRCELLDRAAIHAVEPDVSRNVRGGALFHTDGAINNERLVTALAAAAQRRGVERRLETPVHAIRSAGAGVDVQLAGETVSAAVAVVAAGAWSSEVLAGNGIKIPVRPARGEMAAVRPDTWRLRHILSAGETYLVPRVDGEVLIGSTTAFVGFDKRVTPEGMITLLASAATVVPAVRGMRPLRTWAGLRPCSTIRRPIIAPLPGLEHVILATGHHRNGILLAPITARLVTELITGASPSVKMQPFSYRKH